MLKFERVKSKPQFKSVEVVLLYFLFRFYLSNGDIEQYLKTI